MLRRSCQSSELNPKIHWKDLYSLKNDAFWHEEHSECRWKLNTPWSWVHSGLNGVLIASFLFFALYSSWNPILWFSAAGGTFLIISLIQYFLLHSASYTLLNGQEDEGRKDYHFVENQASGESLEEEPKPVSKWVARYQELERAYYQEKGEPIPQEKVKKKFLPKPEELSIQRSKRVYLPGVYEFETSDPNYVLIFNERIKRSFTSVFMLLGLSILLALYQSWFVFALVFLLVLGLGFLLQYTLLRLAEKRPDLLEVKKWGETPYTEYLKTKKRRKGV